MPARRKDLTKEVIESLYNQGLSQREIAERLHTSQDLISHYMKALGIKSRTKSENMSGSKHWHWQGGKATHKQGYIMLYRPNHPRATSNGEYIMEHVLVMEKHLGRFLTDNERIHHLNGIKTDNRIENLELMTNSEHAKLHNTPERVEAFKKMSKEYWTPERNRAKALKNPRSKDPITGRFIPAQANSQSQLLHPSTHSNQLQEEDPVDQ